MITALIAFIGLVLLYALGVAVWLAVGIDTDD